MLRPSSEPGPAPTSRKPSGPSSAVSRLCAQAAHLRAVEELHPAVGVVDDEPLLGAEQLVGDHERPDRVVAGAAAGVADHVRIALAQARVLGRVEPGVHAGEDREAARRRQGQLALRRRTWLRTARSRTGPHRQRPWRLLLASGVPASTRPEPESIPVLGSNRYVTAFGGCRLEISTLRSASTASIPIASLVARVPLPMCGVSTTWSSDSSPRSRSARTRRRPARLLR